MPPATTKKIAPEIDAKLWKELVAVAKQNGQSQRYVLEQARSLTTCTTWFRLNTWFVHR